MLQQLIGKCGAESVIALMDEGFLTVSFLAQPAGIRTYDSLSWEAGTHEITFRLYYNLADEAEKAFRDHTQSVIQGRDLAKRFITLVHPIGYRNDFTSRFGLDLENIEYVRNAITRLLRMLAPGYVAPGNLRFDIAHHASQFQVQTNIDFAKANEYFQTPPDAPHIRQLDIPLLLLYLLEARADLEFASHFRAEIASSPAGAALMQLRLHDIFAAMKRNMDEIETFERMVLPEGHRIRDVINSEERTYSDLIALLRHAQKFRSWLENQAPSEHLAREYYRAVIAKTWVDKLPGKAFRWFIINTTGTVLGNLASAAIGDPLAAMATGAVVSNTVSGIDTFLLDNILRGWKPNQFVEGELMEFVTPS